MLKSCVYCGKIHDRKFACNQKAEATKKRMSKDSDEKENKFRWSRAWKKKTEEIKIRDNYLCQICIRELYDTQVKYNPYQLSVHHISKLKDDYGSRLDDDNLVTLCSRHHDMADRGCVPSSLLRNIAKEQQDCTA